MSTQTQYKPEYGKNKYVDLKINGRMFPSWVLANFRKYKLPEIIKVAGEDPCNMSKDSSSQLELRKYQRFISTYLDYKSPFRDILIYHGLGSGKTGSAINVYNALYNYTPGWNVFLLLKASLRGNWLGEIKKWLLKDDYDYRFNNIIFLHYDSPFADKNFNDAKKNVDSSKKTLYIIDEVHNFMRNVYSNMNSLTGKRAQVIYDAIIQDKKENPDTRVVLLSGTPAINNPFELSLLFNLLRPGIFPRSENEFNHLFISTTNYSTMNKNNKNLFQRRILGLVSYYYGATPDNFATQKLNYVDVPMSDYHEDIYNYFEEIEDNIAKKARGKSGGSQVYKSYTRQSANFVFPAISQFINGEGRPRPNKFRISEREAQKLLEGKENKDDLKAQKDGDKVMNVSKYLDALNAYGMGFNQYLDKFNDDDIKAKYTIMDDVETFKTKYKNDFASFHKNEKKKSSLYGAMTKCSTKMTNMIFNIMMSPGPTLVYSNYVLMEGLQIFKVYLRYFNFYNYMETKQYVKGKIGYVEFHGSIKQEDRYKGMEAYNKTENKYGEFIKIILISPAGSEGLSLSNCRQVHIMEPYWNEVRITQMVGRAIRFCSHKDLKQEERHVEVFRYKSIKTKTNKWTTDQYIEDLARSKDGLIQSFLSTMKEAAIDCELNRNHNMLVEEYKCFQFDENRLFDQYIGPAYKEDINDDVKIENGLNSMKSTSIKIKVMKIQAAILLSKPDEELKYSEVKDYWYYDKSHTVYDYELHFAIGKVATDENGFALKLDKDTYIIDYMIPIPIID